MIVDHENILCQGDAKTVLVFLSDSPLLEILLSSFLHMSSRCSFMSVAVLDISLKENWGLIRTFGTMGSGGTHSVGKFYTT